MSDQMSTAFVTDEIDRDLKRSLKGQKWWSFANSGSQRRASVDADVGTARRTFAHLMLASLHCDCGMQNDKEAPCRVQMRWTPLPRLDRC